MIVDSVYFLIGILMTVVCCWILPRKAVLVVLMLSCGLYLLFYSPLSLIMLLIVSLMTGWVLITNNGNHRYIIFTIVISCFMLFFYRVLIPPADNIQEVVLIGFAFYILRVIHVLLDSYSAKINRPTWEELFCWLWFIPTLQIGPIHRFQPFQRDLAILN